MKFVDMKCRNCGNIFEEDLDVLKLFYVCPKCGSDSVYRIFTKIKPIYKTEGFYATDNKKVED